MRVISSVVKASKKPWDTFWAWIAKAEPRVCEGAGGKKCQKLPVLLRASRLWLYWNEHIETYADIRFKVSGVWCGVWCVMSGKRCVVCGLCTEERRIYAVGRGLWTVSCGLWAPPQS